MNIFNLKRKVKRQTESHMNTIKKKLSVTGQVGKVVCSAVHGKNPTSRDK